MRHKNGAAARVGNGDAPDSLFFGLSSNCHVPLQPNYKLSFISPEVENTNACADETKYQSKQAGEFGDCHVGLLHGEPSFANGPREVTFKQI
jgi:hypothetical protein